MSGLSAARPQHSAVRSRARAARGRVPELRRGDTRAALRDRGVRGVSGRSKSEARRAATRALTPLASTLPGKPLAPGLPTRDPAASLETPETPAGPRPGDAALCAGAPRARARPPRSPAQGRHWPTGLCICKTGRVEPGRQICPDAVAGWGRGLQEGVWPSRPRAWPPRSRRRGRGGRET